MADQKKFFEAIVNYKDKFIFETIKEDPSILNMPYGDYSSKATIISDAYNCTPLSFLAKRNNFEDSKKFLELGANVDGAIGPQKEDGTYRLLEKFSPLCNAAIANNTKIVEFLLSKGAKIDIRWQNQYQAIHAAVDADSVSSARLILEAGADVSSEAEHGKFPLYLAKSIDMQNVLLEFGANINQISSFSYKGTALTEATEAGNVRLIKNLLKKGADVNIGKNNHTSLHVAVLWEKTEIVKILLENGAKKDIKDSEGKFPIDYAKIDELKNLLK